MPSEHAAPSSEVCTHLPPVHLSLVHTLLSLHWASAVQVAPQFWILVNTHVPGWPPPGPPPPPPVLHVSLVQALLSLQTTALPMQAPALQPSVVVQGLPSVQVVPAVAAVVTHLPVAASHESSVQALLSLQLTALPAVQAPAWQVSPAVQLLPSSQAAPVSST